LIFVNVIFFIFLLISTAVFLFLVLLIRQIRSDGRLSKEKLTNLTGILFVPLLIVFALFFKGISNWRNDIQEEQNIIEIENFVNDVYQPLADSHSDLRDQLIEIQTVMNKIEELSLSHPNQMNLIQSVSKQWSLAHASLYEVYSGADKEIRRAWIAHSTMDRQDVLFKFSKQAVKIHSQIQFVQKDYENYLFDIKDEMIKALDQARKLLEEKLAPIKSKKQLALNESLRKTIGPISSQINDELLKYITYLDNSLAEDFNAVHEIIRVAAQQSSLTQDLLFKNPDLVQPLTIVINDWNNLERSANESVDQINYAIESEYIVRQLGLPIDDPAIKAMHQILIKVIPLVRTETYKQKDVIDHSYSINVNR